MGFDRSLFVTDVPGDCVCAICQEVLEDPKETLTCQHAFCGNCITRWLRDHSSCPSCRCPLSLNDLVPLHRIWREKLNRLRIRCLNVRVGCKTVVPLNNLEHHFETCPFVRVSCPHSPCSEIIKRSHLLSHAEICNYRKVICDTCNLKIPAVEQSKHQCLVALKEDFERRIDAIKVELTNSLRILKQENNRLESQVHEQAMEISYLKHNVSAIISNQRQHNPQLPSIKVSTSRTRLSHEQPTCQLGREMAVRRASQTSTLSLPRLAPLHTHMSLSRTSGSISGKECNYNCPQLLFLFNRRIPSSR